MDWLDFLVRFLVFVGIVAVVFYGYQWLAQWAGFPEPVNRVIRIFLGIVALIVFLVRFVKPLLRL